MCCHNCETVARTVVDAGYTAVQDGQVLIDAVRDAIRAGGCPAPRREPPDVMAPGVDAWP